MIPKAWIRQGNTPEAAQICEDMSTQVKVLGWLGAKRYNRTKRNGTECLNRVKIVVYI